MNEEELKIAIKKLKKVADILTEHNYESMRAKLEYMSSEEYIQHKNNPFFPIKEDPYTELQKYINDLRDIDTFNSVLDMINAILYLDEVKEAIEEDNIQ